MNPINLKKNDKLILILGIIILVVSAIGIAAYTSYDVGDKEVYVEPEIKTFEYNWIEETKPMEVDGYVGKTETYSKSFTIDTNSGSVLTSVDISIVWNDDYTHGLLIKKGEDTLTATITYGGQTEEYNGKGSGNKELSSFKINDIPVYDSVEAKDYNEAVENINSMFSLIYCSF